MSRPNQKVIDSLILLYDHVVNTRSLVKMTRLRVGQIGSVKKRYLGRYCSHVLDEEQNLNMSLLCLILSRRARQQQRQRSSRRFMLCALLAAAKLDEIGRDIQHFTQPIERRYLTFATANPSTFTAFFRFPLEHMSRLLACLRIPEYFTLDNGSVVNGQEGLLVMLRLLAYPLRLIDTEEFFGWEMTRLSRINSWMMEFIYRKHKHRVQNYLHWHVRYIKQCKTAMQNFKMSISLTGTLAHRTRNVAWIIDGFRCSVCRPSQPQVQLGEPEPNVDLQCLVYNKWKKVHNILFQNVTTPYGLIADFAGPVVGKNNDLNILGSSNVLHRFRTALMAEGLNPADYDMLGDKLYMNVPNLWRLYKQPMTEQAEVDNTIESEPRSMVEWVNGKISSNWKGLRFKEKQKLRLFNVGRCYVVAALLTNAHTLLLGGQSMNYMYQGSDPFNLEMPSIENYFEI